jgi:hypothetical protein
MADVACNGQYLLENPTLNLKCGAVVVVVVAHAAVCLAGLAEADHMW